ncbi:hypothetical protein DBR42_18675 [Pelomonas sp. HMWF004]|nr:hypothetical protein DBR42_18675 [Pelomonas sp. HMWF004]
MAKKSFHSLDITVAGLGQLVIKDASGEVDGAVLTCQGGTLVDGQDPPEVNGVYDIAGSGANFTNATCTSTTASNWAFSIGGSGE